ncbi:unnamed protein product [Mytilus edulis]|uniref:Fibrinogen C-terminal domain-containing protein n=1 Tax=Mytilus edulis TaxID=6550 RepID=A0A8S3PMA3_MYTED|nr:unnamed protein product [Mytilus edulis]
MRPNVTKLPRECSDIEMTNPADGVYTIYPDGKRAVPVYCDMTTANFRWTQMFSGKQELDKQYNYKDTPVTVVNNGGQECLSCSNIETVQDCQHYIVCDNTEVCYKQKFATESGGTSYDFGCSQPKTCNHLIGSIFGKRSEGHHIICSGCCNNTRLCNQDITCLNVKTNNTRVPQECSDINIKNRTDGVYTIYPDGQRATPVYCDMTTKNLSWTVIQRRINGFIDFYRGWSAYKDGFGDVNSEYWLGR